MILYPAIDILGGKCVRLFQGKKETAEIFYENPLDAAKMWVDRGAKALHIVDLDGAFEGVQKNLNVIENIACNVSIPLQVGGGIRSLKAINNLLSAGVKRPILGSSVVLDDAFLTSAIESCGQALVVSIDTKDGRVATNGWVKVEDISGLDLAVKLRDMGVRNIVYTDISRDGSMEGLNLEALRKMCSLEGLDVIASGGIRNIEDIKKAEEAGAVGAISGKALYLGTIDFEKANRI